MECESCLDEGEAGYVVVKGNDELSGVTES